MECVSDEYVRYIEIFTNMKQKHPKKGEVLETMPGKSRELGSLVPGKCYHLEGNKANSHEEIHRYSGKFVVNVTIFPGSLHFFQSCSPTYRQLQD